MVEVEVGVVVPSVAQEPSARVFWVGWGGDKRDGERKGEM